MNVCRYFYVVALKLKDNETPSSPDSYESNELVTYDEARKSTNQKPYIAAIITSKDENMFILGDGKNTSNPTTRRRRATTTDYYNGPLKPGSSYKIFQRIFVNEKVTLHGQLGEIVRIRNRTVFKECYSSTVASYFQAVLTSIAFELH